MIAHTAREKAADAHARARKSEHGLFHFKSQKMLTKLSARLTECEDRLAEVRNEYLLTLAALRAHQQHYYGHDLPAVMEQMDGSLYEELRGHFTRLCGTELDTCAYTHTLHSRVWDTVHKVTRQKHVQQFLQDSTAFCPIPEFSFQPAPTDQIRELQDLDAPPDPSCLQREVNKWASKAAKDYKVITHGERAVEVLEGRLKLLSGETSLSVEQKIAEVQDTVRKAKLSRVKAEARLQLLSQSVAGTEAHVGKALHQAQEEVERDRRLSEHRRSIQQDQEEEFELSDLDEYEEEEDTFADGRSPASLCVYPAACRVLYSYQARHCAPKPKMTLPELMVATKNPSACLQSAPVHCAMLTKYILFVSANDMKCLGAQACQSDELSVTEGEELQVVEDGDMEDWLKVCNACGQVGYVPERYVQFLCLPAEDTIPLDASFSSTSSLGHREDRQGRGLARALYSYQAQSAEELSFQEGRSSTLSAADIERWMTASGRESWTGRWECSLLWWWRSFRMKQRTRRRTRRRSLFPPLQCPPFHPPTRTH
uniref:SH3 domain-containing protein n=1 Tax=Neogobius melanostomus TaxID=47308 RepID=A0A8C6WUC2_9GOBI